MNTARVRVLVRNGVRTTLRDRGALFFTFLFPLLFLFIFAAVFGGSGSDRPTLYLSGQGQLATTLRTLSATGQVPLKVVTQADAGKAISKVRNGDAAAALLVDGQRATLRYAASDVVRSAIVRGVLAGVVNQLNLRAANARPTYAVASAQVEDTSESGVDFYVPGLLGYAIATSGTFGLSLVLVTWRTNGLLRRLRLSPLRASELISARVLISLGVALAQAVLMIGVGVAVFSLHLRGAPWAVFPITLIGALPFLAVGMVAGGVAKSEDAAVAIANVIVLPMSFLSGAFFPLDSAPSWLQTIGKAMPLHYLIDALRNVAVRGRGVSSTLPDLAVLLATAAVISVIALRLFRWSDDEV